MSQTLLGIRHPMWKTAGRSFYCEIWIPSAWLFNTTTKKLEDITQWILKLASRKQRSWKTSLSNLSEKKNKYIVGEILGTNVEFNYIGGKNDMNNNWYCNDTYEWSDCSFWRRITEYRSQAYLALFWAWLGWPNPWILLPLYKVILVSGTKNLQDQREPKTPAALWERKWAFLGCTRFLWRGLFFYFYFFFSFDLEGAKYGFPVFLREFQRKGKRGEPRRTPCNPTNQVDFFSKAATRKN